MTYSLSFQSFPTCTGTVLIGVDALGRPCGPWNCVDPALRDKIGGVLSTFPELVDFLLRGAPRLEQLTN
jgi:hypothetical protein